MVDTDDVKLAVENLDELGVLLASSKRAKAHKFRESFDIVEQASVLTTALIGKYKHRSEITAGAAGSKEGNDSVSEPLLDEQKLESLVYLASRPRAFPERCRGGHARSSHTSHADDLSVCIISSLKEPERNILRG